MQWVRMLAAISLTMVGASAAVPFTGDARHGKALFLQYRCIECHAILGEGGKLAADLGPRLDRA